MIAYEAVITYVHENLIVNVGEVGDVILIIPESDERVSAFHNKDTGYHKWQVLGVYDPNPPADYHCYNFCCDILTGEEINV